MEREHIIKEITDLADRIKAHASDPETLVTDVTHLYEMVILLKHLPEMPKTNGQAHVAAEPLSAQKEEILIQAVKAPAEEKPQATLDLFSVEENHTPAKTEEPVIASAPAPKKETPKTAPSKKKKDESVAEKLQHNKIADLKAAIGINEKFQFINALFDGNMKEYTVAIDQINSFSSLDEAESYIANLENVYKWDPENHIAAGFKELAERRFV